MLYQHEFILWVKVKLCTCEKSIHFDKYMLTLAVIGENGSFISVPLSNWFLLFFFSSDYILVKNRNSHRQIKLHANKYCRTFGTLKAP